MGENLLMHVSILRQHCKHLPQIAAGEGQERGAGAGWERMESRGSRRQEKHACAAAPQMPFFSKHKRRKAFWASPPQAPLGAACLCGPH